MNNTVENYENIQELADQDVMILEAKGKTYGRSWMKRGGIGAMMMLARKWDRIENIVREHGWDIFEASLENTGDINDDIADLRRYLLLVESEVDMQRMYRDDQAEIKLGEPLVSVTELETGGFELREDACTHMGELKEVTAKGDLECQDCGKRFLKTEIKLNTESASGATFSDEVDDLDMEHGACGSYVNPDRGNGTG